MIGDGLSLALITGFSFYAVFTRLPKSWQRWLSNHALFTNVTTCLLTYLLFGGTLVALFAAAWLHLIISVMIIILQNQAARDMITQLQEKLSSFLGSIWDWLKGAFPPTVRPELA